MTSKSIFATVPLILLPAFAYGEVTINNPWARASVIANRPGAAYLTIESDTGDRLVGVATPVAKTAMIHEVETDGQGVSRMIHLDALDIPADAPVNFAPSKMHLMLMGLAERLKQGSSFPLTLTFETAGEVTVEVPVLGVGATGPEVKE